MKPPHDGVSPGAIRFHRLNGLGVSFVFAFSIGVAYVSVWAVAAVWITLFVVDHALLYAFEARSS